MEDDQIPLDDLSCQVCFVTLAEPVDQLCSHRVCNACAELAFKNTDNCPVCKGLSSTDNQVCTVQEPLCSLHNDQLKLFCLEDIQLVCLTCQTSKEHENHKCCPVDQMELKTTLKPLQEKLVSFRQVKQSCNKTAQHIKNKARRTECQITEEFEKLYNFLRDEEAARIAALRTEKEQKLQMINERIENINSEMASLSQTIIAVQEPGDTSFIQNIESSLNRTESLLQDAHLASGSLIDVAKHVGNLMFKVWEKMQNIVQYNPVILDPNTANPSLVLSEDLTSVTFVGANAEKTAGGQDILQLPDNPERFDTCMCVLGSEGFSSGCHAWEFEFGNNYLWEVGISLESNPRKGGVFLDGVWSIESNIGFYICYPSKPKSVFSDEGGISAVGIRLDCDRGRFSFYDPLDNGCLMSVTHTFNEKVYPFVWTRAVNLPIKIVPMAGSVVLEQPDDDDDDDGGYF